MCLVIVYIHRRKEIPGAAGEMTFAPESFHHILFVFVLLGQATRKCALNK